MSEEHVSAEPSVVLDEVSVFYGEVVGLSSVSLSMAPGITGLVGPNGSGKTTLMRLLTGLMPAREGELQVLGGDPFEDASIRARIALVPASECFFDRLSARQNLEIGFVSRGESAKNARKKADAALESVGLLAEGHRIYRTWSRGMRQRLKLALALNVDVDVVLLDEPFLGVDPPSRRRIRQLVEELGKTAHTVLISSHVLHEIESLTDRVAILAHGRLLGHGQVKSLLEALREQHPMRILLQTDKPRELASLALAHSGVLQVRFDGEQGLELLSAQPEELYRRLPQWLQECGAVVRRLSSPDESLEALIEQVTSA
ncbi:MAG: ABC transporter ATP-binding protein, partial [Myxococcota bacterium]|nr:ABC transporter ATP-binding protein [Myxococcota bacterium]